MKKGRSFRHPLLYNNIWKMIKLTRGSFGHVGWLWPITVEHFREFSSNSPWSAHIVKQTGNLINYTVCIIYTANFLKIFFLYVWDGKESTMAYKTQNPISRNMNQPMWKRHFDIDSPVWNSEEIPLFDGILAFIYRLMNYFQDQHATGLDIAGKYWGIKILDFDKNNKNRCWS